MIKMIVEIGCSLLAMACQTIHRVIIKLDYLLFFIYFKA